MIRLQPAQYPLAARLITDCTAELSVFSVLAGTLPGAVFADDAQNPAAVLIRTSETTVLAGNPNIPAFLTSVRRELGFWENFTLDSPDWEAFIPKFHPNAYIRRYERSRLTCQKLLFTDFAARVPEGMTLERITPELLAEPGLENADIVHRWAANWGLPHFFKAGAGFAVRQGDILCSWSVTDCILGDRAAIGIVTDSRFRRRGLAAIAAAACAAHWFEHGMRELDWLCVGANTGSQATARKLGFSYAQSYPAWVASPPYENDGDQTPAQWAEWAAFYAEAYRRDPEGYRAIMERCRRNAGLAE